MLLSMLVGWPVLGDLGLMREAVRGLPSRTSVLGLITDRRVTQFATLLDKH